MPGRSSPLSGAGEPGRVSAADREARNSQNEGTSSATTIIAATITSPPDTIATVTDAAVATAPAQTWMLATTHPSAILRTPDEGRAAAYDALVADLAVVAHALA